MKSCNMNSSHTEFQMVFSAEEVSLELQALGELGFTGAMYFGINLVSVLLREQLAVSVKKKSGLYLRKHGQIQYTFETLQKIFRVWMG